MPGSGRTGRKRSKSCTRGCETAQKVVIPKGMINPDETTIIEIPCSLHGQPVVVAKRKNAAPCGEEDTDKATNSHENSFHSTTGQEEGEPVAAGEESNIEEPPFHSTSIQQEDQCGLSSPNAVEQIGNILGAGANINLDETEEEERVQLQKDLEAYQKARRKLLERTTKFATQLPTDPYDAGNTICNYTSKSAARKMSKGCTRSKRENTMIDPRFDQDEYARQLYNVL